MMFYPRHSGRPGLQRPAAASGFTIIELLVATAILSVVLVVVVSVIGQTSAVWRKSTDKIEAFQGARMAFDLLTRNLSQATLNTYLDYDDPFVPTKYLRKAELKFVSRPTSNPGTAGTGQSVFFQAPASFTSDMTRYGNLESLLNTCGYYVEFGSDAASKPTFVSSPDKYRYRLMQLLIPTEENKVYTSTGQSWITDAGASVQPVADNIIALIIRPQDPGMTAPSVPGVTVPNLTSDYTYDTAQTFSGNQPLTSNQLPPVLQVTMVAIDENSAKRVESNNSEPSAIRGALTGKFTDPARYTEDLRDLETALTSATPPISYRIFTSAVPIRESKWSR
jgi:uncharacterized protein (TIGR02599 family)